MIDSDLTSLLTHLHDAGVEFLVVGGAAAVFSGAPIVTFDLDVVHRRTPENVDRLLAWLLEHQAYHRLDLANRRLPPTREPLLGKGHLNLQTNLGKLDVLGELAEGQGYDELLPHAFEHEVVGRRVLVLGLEKVIEMKARAGRPKDKAVLPLLLATLDERKKAKR
jgi:predicted nucleotidyltransferase